MKNTKKSAIIILGVIPLLYILGHIPIWIEDNNIRENKSKIKELINIGQNLNEAEAVIKKSGFKLMYEDAITPTYNKSYLSQLVIVGETKPNVFETFAYVTQLEWMPFTSNESPYLIIEANLDGTITEIK